MKLTHQTIDQTKAIMQKHNLWDQSQLNQVRIREAMMEFADAYFEAAPFHILEGINNTKVYKKDGTIIIEPNDPS